MLVRLQSSPSPELRESVLASCRELGLEPVPVGDRPDLLEIRGPLRPDHRSLLEDLTGIAAILDRGDARELALRAPGGADTVVAVGQARFGGGALALIAGPCAVEDQDRLLEIARGVRRAGATCLRGGAFKPRTSPYSFQGLGPEGLELLARARLETGLAVVTEVLDPREIERVGAVCDAFQVGSRSMSNGTLLRELGHQSKPVLLKRGMAATAREFLLAAEYVLAGGNGDVVLCERGVRGFDTVTRNVLDLGTVAWLKRETHLPVIVDPSHAAGDGRLVRALSRAGVAAGADGLILEVHSRPEEARSDGAQAVSVAEFETIVSDVRALCALDGRQLSIAETVRSA